MNNLYLIGMMGSGKTTLGRRLAEALRREFVDLDAHNEARCGMSTSEQFARYGEAGFREREAETLRLLAEEKEGAVVATGGGIVLLDENVRRMRESGAICFLMRTPEHIMESLDAASRPLLREDPSKLFSIYEARRPRYLSAADHIIENDGTEEAGLAALIAWAKTAPERSKR